MAEASKADAEAHKADAKAIQQRLSELGLLDPPPDGVFGSVSTWALTEAGWTEQLTVSNANECLDYLNAQDPWPLKPGDDLAGNIVRAMQRNSYWICRHPDCFNIIYVEGMNEDGTRNDNVPNEFNDCRVLIRCDDYGVPKLEGMWESTTEPGEYWTENPMNSDGAARIAFGQYKAWNVGIHNESHEALVQTADEVSVYRDYNQDYKRDGDMLDTGFFGINQHWGYDNPPDDLGTSSAGCLVGRSTDGHKAFMKKVKADARYHASGGSYSFMSTVMPVDEVLGKAPPPPPRAPVPVEERPSIKIGAEGPDVEDVQVCLNAQPVDGEFGPVTDTAVREFQRDEQLTVDGWVGQDTWTALYLNFPWLAGGEAPPARPTRPSRPARPARPATPLTPEQEVEIRRIAALSEVAEYNWPDRGVMPPGYCQGFALTWAVVVKKFHAGESETLEMAKANTHNDDKDAISWYNSNFKNLGMTNESAGIDTLRHLWMLMLGHGMNESSGRHCCGRDQSAGSSSQSSDTCEAGLFQTSYNAHACSKEFDKLFEQCAAGEMASFFDVFELGVSCDSEDWENYGSGNGEQFQDMCKNVPPFACETAAIVLRNLKDHYGPIVRKEVPLVREADTMLREVQDYIQSQMMMLAAVV